MSDSSLFEMISGMLLDCNSDPLIENFCIEDCMKELYHDL